MHICGIVRRLPASPALIWLPLRDFVKKFISDGLLSSSAPSPRTSGACSNLARRGTGGILENDATAARWLLRCWPNSRRGIRGRASATLYTSAQRAHPLADTVRRPAAHAAQRCI